MYIYIYNIPTSDKNNDKKKVVPAGRERINEILSSS